MEGDKGTVCVTGGTGFIASWMIKQLLELGYSVNTTIRPDSDKRRDISFLTGLPGADERLKVFRADLRDPDSFDAAIEGCNGVIHVATPIHLEEKEPEEVVTKRTIDGALGILKACLRSETVKKVVYTSSGAAVQFGKYQDVEMVDESSWTDTDSVRETKAFGSSYTISKTLTERAALEFAAEHGLDLVTVVPSLVTGPFICPRFPGSVQYSLAPILPGIQNQNEWMGVLVKVSMVHVDDLSRAHIFLLEHPTANGRYICSSHTITLEKIVQILSTNYTEFSFPTPELLANVKGTNSPGSLSSKKLLDTGFKFNNYTEFSFPTPELLANVKGTNSPGSLSSKKLLDTGFKFKYGIEDMYDEAIRCCKEKGFL